MKILLDCVLTAKDPAQCSTNIQFITFVNQTLKRRDDIFFYWLVPEWVEEELFLKAYPQHKNVRYIKIKQHKDRTKEYLTLSKELDNAVAFNGEYWDFDALLTMRAGLVPLLKMLATSPRNYRLHWLRKVWLIEAMVVMSFKATVLKFDVEAEDLFTLGGYLAADRVFLTSQADKDPIVQRAREILAPSRVRMLMEKIQPVGYGSFSTPVMKSSDSFPDPMNGKPMCIAHAGRMEKANRIDEINDLMVKNFVMLGDKVKLLVCTVSTSIKAFDQSVVEIKQASREEFWDMAKSEMHLIVNMSDESGSALSVLEPMMFGVPAILGPRKRTEKAIGADYPFIVNNEVEAYAMVRMFFDDYAGMYARWAEWQQTRFKEILSGLSNGNSVYTLLGEAVDNFEQVYDEFKEKRPGQEDNAMTKDMLEFLGDKTEFVFGDVVKEMVVAKRMDPVVLTKLNPADRDYRGLAWSTDFNTIRNVFKAFYGWKDASTKVGHLKKEA